MVGYVVVGYVEVGFMFASFLRGIGVVVNCLRLERITWKQIVLLKYTKLLVGFGILWGVLGSPGIPLAARTDDG